MRLVVVPRPQRHRRDWPAPIAIQLPQRALEPPQTHQRLGTEAEPLPEQAVQLPMAHPDRPGDLARPSPSVRESEIHRRPQPPIVRQVARAFRQVPPQHGEAAAVVAQLGELLQQRPVQPQRHVLDLLRLLHQLAAAHAEPRRECLRPQPNTHEVHYARRPDLHRPETGANQQRARLGDDRPLDPALERVAQIEDQLGAAVGHGSLERSGPRCVTAEHPYPVHQLAQLRRRGHFAVFHDQLAAAVRLACW